MSDSHESRNPDPLAMAQNAAAAVARYAEYSERDPFSAAMDNAGPCALHAAQLAGDMALVSMPPLQG